MEIRVAKISTLTGVVYATVDVDVPNIAAKARINMHFPAPPGTGPKHWRKFAYDRALMMLDPA